MRALFLLCMLGLLPFCVACMEKDSTERKDQPEAQPGQEGSREDLQQTKANKTILFLGDSLTAGYGLRDSDEAFPQLIQSELDRLQWGFEILNGGVSGDTSSSGLRRVDWFLRRRVDVLFLELGANDGLRGISLAVTEENLQGIIDKARERYPDIRIVIAGMMIPPNLGPEYSSRFRSIFLQLAERNDAVLIPFLLEGVAGRPELNQADGIHPTAEGHALVAEHVWKYLKPVLEPMVAD